MDRRQALKLLAAPLLLSSPLWFRFGNAHASDTLQLKDDTFVLLYDSASGGSGEFLRSLAPRLAKRDPQWQQKLRFLDVKRNSFEVKDFIYRYGRNTTEVQFPILIAVHDRLAAEPEVEVWTPRWIDHVKSLADDACYPVSQGWWSVEGDWNPSATKVRNHLFHSPNHTEGQFEQPWLDLLEFEELQSVHSDHHREMTNQGRVYWDNVNVPCPPR